MWASDETWPLGTMSACAINHGNPFNSRWDISPRSTNTYQQVALCKTRVNEIHPLGTMHVWTRFNDKPSDGSGGIWTRRAAQTNWPWRIVTNYVKQKHFVFFTLWGHEDNSLLTQQPQRDRSWKGNMNSFSSPRPRVLKHEPCARVPPPPLWAGFLHNNS